METRTSTRDTAPPTANVVGTARHPAVIATPPAPLLPSASTVGPIEARANRPALPPGPVVPLVAAGLLIRHANRRTTGLAPGTGLFVGAPLVPNTGEHLPSGNTTLIALRLAGRGALTAPALAGRGALTAPALAGTTTTPARKGAPA
ncbi:hypothetical protein [Streptomyces sp. NPDC005374]|uniref:hypothetical protein n=1 Tax=Streptomyces sp. NPDC005374 TaxID=3364713 RepID=UPI00367C0377